ncbi:MAG TPA: hypothetical protein VGK74_11605 [Symbiobacteriaceae bacterium]
MGTVVRFIPRPEDAAAKTEAILTKIGQLYQQKMKAKEELPRVLSQLIENGETELVLRAVMLWGSGEMEPHEVLAMVEEMAAVMGIKPVGDRPF